MTERRGKGEDSIYLEHADACRDSGKHRNCPGRWRGEVCLGYGRDGRRMRRRVSATTKAAVQDQLRALRADLNLGIAKAPPVNDTVRKAAEDWMAGGSAWSTATDFSAGLYAVSPRAACRSISRR